MLGRGALFVEQLLGKKIKYDVTNGYGLVLVPSESVLDQEHLKLIRQHRIDVADIILASDREMTQDSEDSNTSQMLVQKATQYAKDLFERIQLQKKVPLLEVKNELIPIVQEAAEHPDLFQLFEAVKAKDEYTHRHNIGVGVLSTLIGKWLNLGDSEVALLSLAATMHDVGKVQISKEILMKPGKLTDAEFDEMKRHTIYGYNMLRDTVGVSYRASLVALQHHERSDGSGYPLRLKRDHIDPMSRIVAVADIFHAMSSIRPYHEAMPFYEVVSRMRQGFFGELDPYIVAIFLNNMINSLIGRKVLLTDGQWGEVVYINPSDDTHPLVKVGESFIDLSKERNIHIKQVIT